MAANVVVTADVVSGVPITGNIVTKTVVTRFGIPAETSGGGVDPEDIATAVEEYLTENPVDGSGIGEVSEDTSPTLGGNLDLGGHAVGAATAADLTKLHGAGALSGSNTGDQDLSSYATAAAVAAGYQPLDDDLTALAALTAPATKLSGIATGATANDSDANLKDRGNHTGTQTSSTISDFTEAVQDAVAALLAEGSNVTLTYDDEGNSLTVAASGGDGEGLDEEAVRDAIGVALSGIGVITVTVNDAADTITISSTATVNDTDANLKNRGNHTGIQSADTVVDGSANHVFTAADDAKLEGIETGADVTDATNVNAAGAVMNSDSSTADMGFVVDEDDLVSNSATKVPTQQSVKSYVDAATGGAGIGEIVEDISPQLGGDLDLNGHAVGAAVAADLTKLHDAGALSGDNTGDQDLSSLPGTATRAGLIDLQSTPDLRRFRAGGTTRLKSSMLNALAAVGYSSHLIIGDSLSSPYTGAEFDFPHAWHRKLKSYMVASGYADGGTGLVPVCYAESAVDPRFTYSAGGTWTINTTFAASQGGVATLTFVSDVPGTIVDVVYSDSSAAFTVAVDGGSAVTVTPPGGGGVSTYTVTGLSNTAHTVVLSTSNSGVYPLAFRVRQAFGVQFHNFAQFGITAAGWYADSGATSVRTVCTQIVPSPDVVHICLGSNDIANGGTTTDTAAAISNIRGLYPSADVILYAQPQGPTITDGDWNDFLAALYALAATLKCPLVDLRAHWGDSATFLASGLAGADGVHPNATAQADFGRLAWDGISGVLPSSPLAPSALELSNVTTVAVNVDWFDTVVDTGITGAITLSNPTGTPGVGQKLWYSLTGTASRAITYGTAFEDSSIARPTTTSGTARLDLGFAWNPATSKWRLVGYA